MRAEFGNYLIPNSNSRLGGKPSKFSKNISESFHTIGTLLKVTSKLVYQLPMPDRLHNPYVVTFLPLKLRSHTHEL